MKYAPLACGFCTLVAAASASTLLASSEGETSFVLTPSTPPLHSLVAAYRANASVSKADALAEDSAEDGQKKRYCKFKFQDKALEYDLCPVFEHKGKDERHPWNRWIWWKRDTPPTVSSTSYVMSLRGALEKNESRPAEEQCPEGTWICMTMYNYAAKKKEPYRVTQVIPVAGNLPLAENHTRTHHPGLNATVRLGHEHGGADHPDLTIVLHGGMYVGKNQSAALYFHCNESAEEPTNPEYGWEYKGYHVLHWQTRHACPRSLSAAPDPNPKPTPNEPDPTPETPPDDIPADEGGGGGPNKEDDQDFLVPPEKVSTRRSLSVVLSLAILITVGSTGYVLYTRSERVRAFVTTSLPFHISVPTLKSPILPSFSPTKLRSSKRRWRRKGHKGFRPPESRLRTWASEEGVLDDNYERGLLADSEVDLGAEEDFMINGGSHSDLLFASDETDEEMPLTPSPRPFRSSGVKNYGSAG